MMTVGIPSLFASSTGRTRALSSRGASTIPLDPLAREALDHLDLLLAVVLADRPLPDDLDLDALGLQVARGLDGAGVDALPELVGEPLGNDRDLEALRSGHRAGRPRRLCRRGLLPPSRGPGRPGPLSLLVAASLGIDPPIRRQGRSPARSADYTRSGFALLREGVDAPVEAGHEHEAKAHGGRAGEAIGPRVLGREIEAEKVVAAGADAPCPSPHRPRGFPGQTPDRGPEAAQPASATGFACFCASSASSIARKQCACGIAVSVRFEHVVHELRAVGQRRRPAQST